MNSIPEAIAAAQRGEFVIVVDDEDRENEGDLILPACHASTDRVAFLLEHTSGLICVAITAHRAQELDLPLMTPTLGDTMRTAFTVSVDVQSGTSTGISSSDRACTVRALAGTERADAFLRPGHVFPLISREGGVLKRAGHTEAAVDLARLAGLPPAGMICEIVTADRRKMASRSELEALAQKFSLVMISIADLIRYRRRTEKLVHRESSAVVPTPWGKAICHAYRSSLDGIEHLALTWGDVSTGDAALVRIHSECLTGDVFRSRRCDCGEQLETAMDRIGREGRGVVVYLRGHEGRGIGLAHKIRAYALQDQGLDTVDANVALGLPADSREYGIGAQILADLGARKLRLLTNNPAKYGGLEGYGLSVVERLPLVTEPTAENRKYLETKRTRMGHLLGGSDSR